MMSGIQVKAVGLLSGGLDSTLAVKVMQELGVEVVGVTFTTPFFDAEPGLAAGRSAGIEVRPVDIAEEHLLMLRNPRYGFGSWMNPCIDCHALMLARAGKIMEEEGAHFLFTGEVLGQRPMSQRKDSLRSVENLSGYPGRVLRPLSAKLLAPTEPELQGLVDRARLLAVQGRSRKSQTALAAQYGITQYPQPGDGCILTKEGFALKLKALFELYPDFTAREVEFLKHGRHFRLPCGSLLAVGKNRANNEALEALTREEDTLLRASPYPGPLGVVFSPPNRERDLATAAMIVLAYGDAPSIGESSVSWRRGGTSGTVKVPNPGKEHFTDLQLRQGN